MDTASVRVRLRGDRRWSSPSTGAFVSRRRSASSSRSRLSPPGTHPISEGVSGAPQIEDGVQIGFPWVLTAPIDQILLPALIWIDGTALVAGLVWLPLVLLSAIVAWSSPLIRKRASALILCAGPVVTVVVALAWRRRTSFRAISATSSFRSSSWSRQERHPSSGGSRSARHRFARSCASRCSLLLPCDSPWSHPTWWVSPVRHIETQPRSSSRTSRRRPAWSRTCAALRTSPSTSTDPSRRSTSNDVAASVCGQESAVFYVMQPFALEDVPVPCLARAGVQHYRFRQYARGGEMNVWFVPAELRVSGTNADLPFVTTGSSTTSVKPHRHERLLASNQVTPPPQISVIIPCLNEEEAVGKVVEQAFEGIRRSGRPGEVIVVDNASTDSSAEVAAAKGAMVVSEPRRGYGSAYLAGLEAARGDYLVMGDADDTYPMDELSEFVERLDSGDDLVIGSQVQGDDPRGRDAVPEPIRRQSDPHGHAQRPLRREGLRRPLRDARRASGGASRARPPLDRNGVRVRDGLQGVPAGPHRERGPHRLLPARRRVEAEPLRRRLAPRPLHAPLQPELAVPGAGKHSSSSSGVAG